jgi:hypothetical protein
VGCTTGSREEVPGDDDDDDDDDNNNNNNNNPWRDEACIQNFSRKSSKGIDHLVILGVEGRIILK